MCIVCDTDNGWRLVIESQVQVSIGDVANPQEYGSTHRRCGQSTRIWGRSLVGATH
ncbi:hypothetical protein YC2023_033463 [Brassica napus]